MYCIDRLPVDQLVEQQALVEVLKLALLHPAAHPLQPHVTIHARVIVPASRLVAMAHMGCGVDQNTTYRENTLAARIHQSSL